MKPETHWLQGSKNQRTAGMGSEPARTLFPPASRTADPLALRAMQLGDLCYYHDSQNRQQQCCIWSVRLDGMCQIGSSSLPARIFSQLWESFHSRAIWSSCRVSTCWPLLALAIVDFFLHPTNFSITGNHRCKTIDSFVPHNCIFWDPPLNSNSFIIIACCVENIVGW